MNDDFRGKNLLRCKLISFPWRHFYCFVVSSFLPLNRLQRYQLYASEDYLQLPVEVISPLSQNTIACESGPDVGLVDIARHQSNLFVCISCTTDF